MLKTIHKLLIRIHIIFIYYYYGVDETFDERITYTYYYIYVLLLLFLYKSITLSHNMV